MIEPDQLRHCLCLACWLEVCTRKLPVEKITIDRLYQLVHFWMHGKGRKVPYLFPFNYEMAEYTARLANIRYDRTKVVLILLAAYRNGEEEQDW
jgi:hypothetical protein